MSKEIVFNHSTKNVFEALGLTKEQFNGIGELIDEKMSSTHITSEAVEGIVKSIKKVETGESIETVTVSEKEISLMVAGMIVGQLQSDGCHSCPLEEILGKRSGCEMVVVGVHKHVNPEKEN